MLLGMGPLEMMERHPAWFGLGYAFFAALIGYTDIYYEGKPARGSLHWWVGTAMIGNAIYRGCGKSLPALFGAGLVLLFGTLFILGHYSHYKNRT